MTLNLQRSHFQAKQLSVGHCNQPKPVVKYALENLSSSHDIPDLMDS